MRGALPPSLSHIFMLWSSIKRKETLPYPSMSLQPVVGPWPLFQFLHIFT
jgi:hypothetical protein